MTTKIDTTPFRVDDKDDFYMSVSKLAGKKIKDITCYISDPYGGGAIPVLSTLIFEDGTEMDFEGEHDTAYLVHYGTKKSAKWVVDLEDLYEDYDEDDE